MTTSQRAGHTLMTGASRPPGGLEWFRLKHRARWSFIGRPLIRQLCHDTGTAMAGHHRLRHQHRTTGELSAGPDLGLVDSVRFGVVKCGGVGSCSRSVTESA